MAEPLDGPKKNEEKGEKKKTGKALASGQFFYLSDLYLSVSDSDKWKNIDENTNDRIHKFLFSVGSAKISDCYHRSSEVVFDAAQKFEIDRLVLDR